MLGISRMSWAPMIQRTWPKKSNARASKVAGEVPEVLRVVPVGVGPVGEAFGPEFEVGKQAVNVRHTECLLEELGVLTPTFQVVNLPVSGKALVPKPVIPFPQFC